MVDLSILMPVYNEQSTVLEAVKRAADADLGGASREVIVVDNGSDDDTPALLETVTWSPDVRLVTLPTNRGKGGAIRVAAEQARGRYVAILDADLEYDPDDLGEMLPPVLEDGMEAVLSTRHWQAHSAFSYWYVLGNKFINTAANVLYNCYISDFASGLKIVRTDLFRSFRLRESGFTFDAEVVANLLRRRVPIYEVPVEYRARSREAGKKITARDGLRSLWVFARCRVLR